MGEILRLSYNPAIIYIFHQSHLLRLSRKITGNRALARFVLEGKGSREFILYMKSPYIGHWWWLMSDDLWVMTIGFFKVVSKLVRCPIYAYRRKSPANVSSWRTMHTNQSNLRRYSMDVSNVGDFNVSQLFCRISLSQLFEKIFIVNFVSSNNLVNFLINISNFKLFCNF